METDPEHERKEPSSAAMRTAWRLLGRTGWLARRSREVRELLEPFARLRQLAAGESLYRVGDVPNGVFGLVEGALEIAIPGLNSEECILHRAEPGFWVGDLALFADQRRLVTIRAAAPSWLVQLPQDALSSCSQRHPELFRDFYELTHENMRTVLSLLGNLAIQSAESRIAMRLLLHADSLPDKAGWIKLSHDDLAQLVAASPKSVRRALGRLQNLALIETGYARIRVTDYHGLARLCGHAMGDSA